MPKKGNSSKNSTVDSKPSHFNVLREDGSNLSYERIIAYLSTEIFNFNKKLPTNNSNSISNRIRKIANEFKIMRPKINNKHYTILQVILNKITTAFNKKENTEANSQTAFIDEFIGVELNEVTTQRVEDEQKSESKLKLKQVSIRIIDENDITITLTDEDMSDEDVNEVTLNKVLELYTMQVLKMFLYNDFWFMDLAKVKNSRIPEEIIQKYINNESLWNVMCEMCGQVLESEYNKHKHVINNIKTIASNISSHCQTSNSENCTEISKRFKKYDEIVEKKRRSYIQKEVATKIKLREEIMRKEEETRILETRRKEKQILKNEETLRTEISKEQEKMYGLMMKIMNTELKKLRQDLYLRLQDEAKSLERELFSEERKSRKIIITEEESSPELLNINLCEIVKRREILVEENTQFFSLFSTMEHRLTEIKVETEISRQNYMRKKQEKLEKLQLYSNSKNDIFGLNDQDNENGLLSLLFDPDLLTIDHSIHHEVNEQDNERDNERNNERDNEEDNEQPIQQRTQRPSTTVKRNKRCGRNLSIASKSIEQLYSPPSTSSFPLGNVLNSIKQKHKQKQKQK